MLIANLRMWKAILFREVLPPPPALPEVFRFIVLENIAFTTRAFRQCTGLEDSGRLLRSVALFSIVGSLANLLFFGYITRSVAHQADRCRRYPRWNAVAVLLGAHHDFDRSRRVERWNS
jgi:hypothetical protein